MLWKDFAWGKGVLEVIRASQMSFSPNFYAIFAKPSMSFSNFAWPKMSHLTFVRPKNRRIKSVSLSINQSRKKSISSFHTSSFSKWHKKCRTIRMTIKRRLLLLVKYGLLSGTNSQFSYKSLLVGSPPYKFLCEKLANHK